ncbi:MAG: PhoX family phosphatase [Pseudomonadota bacterium]
MKDHDLSFDEFDEINSPRPEESDFDRIVESAISRRGFLSVLAVGTASFLTSTSVLSGRADAATDRFGFNQVAATLDDTITIPDGFTSSPVVNWGDPLWSSSPEFDWSVRGTADQQKMAFGDNNDGMTVFAIGDRTVLVINQEYTNRDIANAHRESKLAETDDDVLKGMLAHGVTVVEIAEADDGTWGVVKDSPFNRRITPQTEMEITGPAAGHDLLKTPADPTGTKTLGTWNNCANGETPWGTYLACEENFNGYFRSADKEMEVPAALKRYGVGVDDWGYSWAQIDDRFDISKTPNEPNRAGYVVEIDPTDPNSTPKKRTALGRFKHENAEVVVNRDGRIVVYMGDDERGEFLYRYVSNGVYSAGGSTDDLLVDGKLYAAVFSDDGRGKWAELSEAATGMSKAEIAVHSRQAGSKVGATTMDRPEWVTSNPNKAEVYVALTNNKNRGIKPNKGGDATPVGGPNPREGNKYGQIVRWMPDDEDHAAEGFDWNIFVLAGNPAVHSDDRAGSPNVNAENMFNSPDGIGFDSRGILWIQTDGNYKDKDDFEGHGNNQMLAADTETGEIRRFLVGPVSCEVTGLAWSPDRKTMFVGVQHPGEKGFESHWPLGGDSVPRSGVVAIKRTDGGLMG